MGFTLRTPAKINLYLKVHHQRADGFHNIVSLMQMIGLYDTLSFQEEGTGIHLDVKNGAVPADGTNLVLKAARMLQKKVVSTHHCLPGVRITLDKKIPVSAGLGGGSSDAAATLIGLNRLWSLKFTPKRLAELGGTVGSDVPFFFHGPVAWVSGRGERVCKATSYPRGFVVLVHSGEPVSTALVYQQYEEDNDGATREKDIPLYNELASSIERVLLHPENDLEKVTLKMQPALDTIKKQLEAVGGQGVLMSGSGPTVFARFETKGQADEAACVLRTKGYPNVWVAPLLGRAPQGFKMNPSFSDAI